MTTTQNSSFIDTDINGIDTYKVSTSIVTGSDKDFNNQVSQVIEFFTKGIVTNSSFTNFSTIGDSTRINTSIQVIGASSGARIIIPVLIKKNQSSS